MKIKKILVSLLTIVMLMGLMPQMALAAGPVSINLSTVNASGSGYTYEEITVNSKEEYVVTITDPGDYMLTGTVTQDNHPTHVVVTATTANITLDNANITILNFSPLSINPGSTVFLTLAAGTENTLSLGGSEVGFAGIYVPGRVPFDGPYAVLVIEGTGTLNAYGGSSGAGIGGSINQYNANSGLTVEAGSININSGVINAVGGCNGAGIGGGSQGSCVEVIINGGEVTASTPSGGGTGIGGGLFGISDVLITGGTVIATSGHLDAEAIGTGQSLINASTVTIAGGSIKALSTMRKVSTPKNGSGENVYLTTVTVQDNDSNTLNNTEVSCTVDITTFTAKTDSDGKIYLWLPAGDAMIDISSDGVGYRAVGTVTTDDGTALTSAEFNTVASINDIEYESWTKTVAAVQTGETITLLKDTAILATDTMPAVACTIDGDFHTLTLNSDQGLNTDITLKNLCLASADENNNVTLSCTDSLNNSHKLTINGTVASGSVYMESGSELFVDGTLEVNEMGSFNTMSVAASSTVAAFAVRNISNLELNGTILCKYFTLVKSSGDSGILSGNGEFLFTAAGGESPNLSFSNVLIDSNAQITLDVFEYTPGEGNILVGNKPLGGPATATALANIDKLILGGGYSGFTLTGVDYSFEYDYVLSVKSALKTPSISLSPDTANGGLSYTITPASDEIGAVSGYTIQMLGSDGTTKVGNEISCSGTSGNISISSAILSGGSYCAKVRAVAGATSDYVDSDYSSACTAVQAAQPAMNTIPTRKSGVAATAAASVAVNNAYALNLVNIFTDADSDAMTYKVSINSASAITANANYSYIPTATGTITLKFTANDGTADSEETYTVTLTATNTGGNPTGGGGSSRGGGGSTSDYSANISGTDKDGKGISAASSKVTVNKNTGSAAIDIDSKLGDTIKTGGEIVITIPSILNVHSFAVGIPVESLFNSVGHGSLTVKSDTASITLPSNMLVGVTGISGKTAGISIGSGDKSKLTEAVKAAIGNRPLIELSLTIDGKQTEWNNTDAPVTIAIPYTPTEAELENPESIVIWYIDGNGNAVSVANGHYDSGTGTVTFTTTHFSFYAVSYNKISFNDVKTNSWYSDAVSFIAARGITTGTGDGYYSPDAKLTRGQFIVMLMRAYGIEADTNSMDNFADAGNTYYTDYLAAAKRLGISEGVGGNLFDPDKAITRQEMFMLLYNILQSSGALPEGATGKTLSDFSDSSEISNWATEAMTLMVETGAISGSNDKLYPAETTTRAEMAKVLYNLLTR